MSDFSAETIARRRQASPQIPLFPWGFTRDLLTYFEPPSNISDEMDIELTENSSRSSNESLIPISAYTLVGLVGTVSSVLVIIVVIIVGNGLTIVAVLTNRHLSRQVQNWFIVSLAVADLLVGMLIMPLTLTYQVLDRWIFDMILCELWLALDVLFVTSSILNIAIISLDRYWSITDAISYRHKRTKAHTLKMIAVAWLVAFAISFPPLVGWRPERVEGQCLLSDDVGYVLYSAFGSFYIPSSLLILVYVQIYRTTMQRIRRRSSAPVPMNNCNSVQKQQSIKRGKFKFKFHLLRGTPHSVTLRCVPAPSTASSLVRVNSERPKVHRRSSARPASTDNQISAEDLEEVQPSAVLVQNGAEASSNGASCNRDTPTPTREMRRGETVKRKEASRKKEIRATLILGCIVFAFVACWLPFFFLYVFQALCQCAVPRLLFDIAFWLGYCNSAFNPIIYAFILKDFRKAYGRLLSCR